MHHKSTRNDINFNEFLDMQSFYPLSSEAPNYCTVSYLSVEREGYFMSSNNIQII